MNLEEIDSAIHLRHKLRFCDNGPKGMTVVECVPVARDHIGSSLIVGVFIAEGVRVITVDASLLARTVDGAAKAMARKHQVLSRLTSAGWKYAATEVGISKVDVPQMVTDGENGGSGLIN